jgi:hypothetical protein
LAADMAERIPYLRASYEQAATTPRPSGEPPTITGRIVQLLDGSEKGIHVDMHDFSQAVHRLLAR